MTKEITIRNATKKDIQSIYDIGLRTAEFTTGSKPAFWSIEQLKRWSASPNDVLLVAEHDKQIIGFILSQFHKPTGKATIENIVVLEDHRRHGIAEQLLERCVQKLLRRGANYICALTRTNNSGTISFFEGNHFERGFDFAWMEKDIAQTF